MHVKSHDRPEIVPLRTPTKNLVKLLGQELASHMVIRKKTLTEDGEFSSSVDIPIVSANGNSVNLQDVVSKDREVSIELPAVVPIPTG